MERDPPQIRFRHDVVGLSAYYIHAAQFYLRQSLLRNDPREASKALLAMHYALVHGGAAEPATTCEINQAYVEIAAWITTGNAHLANRALNRLRQTENRLWSLRAFLKNRPEPIPDPIFGIPRGFWAVADIAIYSLDDILLWVVLPELTVGRFFRWYYRVAGRYGSRIAARELLYAVGQVYRYAKVNKSWLLPTLEKVIAELSRLAWGG